MKKHIIFLFAALLCVSQVLWAVPARPGKIVKVQPDGSTVVIRLHGDEYHHWMTNEAGQVVELNAEGFYVVSGKTVEEASAMESDVRMRESGLTPKDILRDGLSKAAAITTGKVYIPVILVQFSDTTFVSQDPAADFHNMLNQDGYAANGATGSVHDFYYENSKGLYDPVFDVLGVVTVNSFQSYNISGSNYGNVARSLIQTACSNLNSSVDFSKYDNDGDGAVDMILMYYAGHNMAEGGMGIWPHQSYLSSTTKYDGKTLSRYFCTSELKGDIGRQMCGVGTTCHEFAHSLGLPDFYDTDYEVNGETAGLYSFSTMCSGSYLNEGRTPPYFSLEERIMLGWVDSDSVIEIAGPGEYTLAASSENVAYRMSTETPGEYFLFEARGYGQWDAYLPTRGMAIYHVDKSTTRTIPIMYASYTSYSTVNVSPYNLWAQWSGSVNYHNSINENGSHPCYYVVPAINPSSLNYQGDQGYLPYPGFSGANQFVATDWNGDVSDLMLRNIRYNSDGSVSFTVVSNSKAVYGQVVDINGSPIAGAMVRVYGSSARPSAAPAGKISLLPSSPQFLQGTVAELTTETDENGNYYLDLSGEEDDVFEIGASANGYVSHIKSVNVSDLAVSQKIALCPIDYVQERAVHYCDLEAENIYLWGGTDSSTGENYDVMASIGFTEEELTPYAGRKIERIAFYAYGGKDATSVASKAYVLVEFGTTRKLFVEVEPTVNGWTYADISGYDIYVPDDTDIHVGYALYKPTYMYPITLEDGSEVIKNSYVGYYYPDEETSTWYSTSWNNMIVMILSGTATVQTLGYNTIDNPSAGYYQAGDTFTFKLNETDERAVSSVEWYFDDEPVSSESIELPEGEHVIEARLTLVNGKKKIVEQKIFVE